MKVIHKYLINTDGSVTMPKHFDLLKVAAQGPEIAVWVVVEKDAYVLKQQLFDVRATGEEAPSQTVRGRRYIDTVFIQHLVFHVFWRQQS